MSGLRKFPRACLSIFHNCNILYLHECDWREAGLILNIDHITKLYMYEWLLCTIRQQKIILLILKMEE